MQIKHTVWVKIWAPAHLLPLAYVVEEHCIFLHLLHSANIHRGALKNHACIAALLLDTSQLLQNNLKSGTPFHKKSLKINHKFHWFVGFVTSTPRFPSMYDSDRVGYQTPSHSPPNNKHHPSLWYELVEPGSKWFRVICGNQKKITLYGKSLLQTSTHLGHR